MDGNFLAPRSPVSLDRAALDWALAAIPPAFPLGATVAVNPYLGLSDLDLAAMGEVLGAVAGARASAPREWYGEKIAAGEIETRDVIAAVAGHTGLLGRMGVDHVLDAARKDRPAATALPTLCDLTEGPGKGWASFVEARLAAWAANFFDDGQALWAPVREARAFADWRAWATTDMAPELAGLKNFRAFVGTLGGTPLAVIAQAVTTLDLSVSAQKLYFLRLLLSLGGWAQAAAHRRFVADRDGKVDDSLESLLAARLAWELYFFDARSVELEKAWSRAKRAYGAALAPGNESRIDAALHEAFEHAERRRLAAKLAGRGSDDEAVRSGRPDLQAVFCIDVRSEVIRRALENQHPRIETLGFAGFFGLGLAYGAALDVGLEARLPVLLKPSVTARQADDGGQSQARARLDARTQRAVGRFKTGAVAAFAFVESLGAASALGLWGRGGRKPAAPTALELACSLTAKIDMAEAALRGMTLTKVFAPLVLIVGHGAHVRNNPHASALQCGACGGHAGDVNALALAQLLNDGPVRAGLAKRGVVVPDDTRFVAALHDTASDHVTLLTHHAQSNAMPHFEQVRRWLDAAGDCARRERAQRRPGAAKVVTSDRAGAHFAELRPEWGLAGCQGFIIASRALTRGVDLDGSVFLHDYDRQGDVSGASLEAIMTAPLVVASWINLAYFGAMTAPDLFGGGDKLLHNVVGGIGVCEGASLTLRPGLPSQSLATPDRLIHPPRRLLVCVDASTSAISKVLHKHPALRGWFEQGWMSLAAFDAGGALAHRWERGDRWRPF